MGSIWEIDFYSRPILDANQKKVWEVLVCESPLDTNTTADSLFRYAQYCPSTQVNSGWLRTALEEAISQAGKAPIKIRFFRRQMNNMITKACQDLGIPAQPSRRTLILNQWLEQRMQEVYPQEPGYQGGTNPSVRLEKPLPQRLPDALEGQQWVFVSLPAGDLAEMSEWEIGFGEAFPLELAQVSSETRIPGVLIFSSRALPLAGWMSGLELAFLKVDTTEETKLLLETGVTESWIVANIKKSQTLAEAKGFEEAKQKANGVHFLGVQSDPQAESFAGFWLLQEVNL
ncbi:MAG: Tab2/Atab2 family RNA-binding protein [Nostoc sp. SerVER01]|uniref:Tab2/Atab2 family RNA-binding protein n=1 Tax=Nostoc sp. CCY 9925 TaxID=3103865 RepID=UPI002ADCFDB8|nr:Tab2/Atab2 family RNA-binding protein [Nostoc sp. SerVER01]MDZ8027690.1 Tab2/Atab2 family RNA-binding protein [Nostoc sp. DedQUE11]MDZ8073403.1 Tab2/Atab2 family RNA-binding protein [Nostoc sp. DedQUE01]MDZ8078455.1 Tab2/Atab2 family RNA-binding protein [Nostoc sp. DcaGUA01]MDZ8241158.1 Tab2/Atab2 family RNA-binding protein [Nostoc sp. ChiQUE01a]